MSAAEFILTIGRGIGEEVLAQQQILGGVAGEGELGKQHEVRALRPRLLNTRADAPRVARDVANGGVHLAERQAHPSCPPID